MEQALNPIGGMGSARPKNDHGVRSFFGEDDILPNNHGLTEPVPPGVKSTDRQSRSLRKINGGMGSARPKNPCSVRMSCGEEAILPKNRGTPRSTDRQSQSLRKSMEGWALPVRRMTTACVRLAARTTD